VGVSSFPRFLELPGELRDDIYRQVLNQQANILVYSTVVLHPGTKSRMSARVEVESWASIRDLRLVSKQISAEFSRCIEPFHTMIDSSLRRGRIIEPVKPEFLALCEQAHVVLEDDPGIPELFLQALAPSTRSCIHSLLFAEYTLDEGWMKQWERPIESKSYAPFVLWLQINMPQLREVELYVPLTYYLDYCVNALKGILDLLSDNVIEVVKLLFNEPLPSGYDVGDNPYLRELLLPAAKFEGCAACLFTRPDAAVAKMQTFVLNREEDFSRRGHGCSKYSWTEPRTLFTLRLHRDGDDRSGQQCNGVNNPIQSFKHVNPELA
jgi:hypothetical protein